MKIPKIFLLFIMLACLAAISCKKSSNTPDPGTGSNFKFSTLVAADTVIKVNDVTTLSAIATGDGLSYKWSSDYGTFVGSGSTVQWTVCHQARFAIKCAVTDKYNNSETKTIVVRAHN